MPAFNVHGAKTNFSQLLEMAERGEEIIVARNGKPVARVVAIEPRRSLLGIGVGDPNYLGHLRRCFPQCLLKNWNGGIPAGRDLFDTHALVWAVTNPQSCRPLPAGWWTTAISLSVVHGCGN